MKAGAFKALPEGYTYRFVEIDGQTKLVGIRDDKPPIVIQANKKGEFEIIELTL